eukprot:superscaffoldBa00000338_g3918
MVNLPPVGNLIYTRDEPNEGGFICKLQELDRLMTGGAAVGVHGEEMWRTEAALRGTSAGSQRCVSSASRAASFQKEVGDPPAAGLRHVQLGVLVLQQSWDNGIKGGAEIHKKDPGIGSCSVQVLEDEVEGHVYCIIHRPVGSVGELQGVQEWVCDGFKVGQYKVFKRLHYHRAKAHRSRHKHTLADMSYGKAESYHPVPRDFNSLIQTCSGNIQKITQNTAQIKSMVNQLGTRQDTSQLQDRLQQIQHSTNQLAKETNKHLKELGSIPLPSSPSEQAEDSSRDEKLVSFENQEDWGQMTTQTEEAAITEEDLELIKERETNIRQLESDIMDVNQIFKDLAVMIHDQGEMIDSIEANVENAEVHVERGTEQLQRAAYYQQKSRKKMCILAMVCSIVLVILGIIIWQAAKVANLSKLRQERMREINLRVSWHYVRHRV